jgi:hypothetical protein
MGLLGGDYLLGMYHQRQTNERHQIVSRKDHIIILAYYFSGREGIFTFVIAKIIEDDVT